MNWFTVIGLVVASHLFLYLFKLRISCMRGFGDSEMFIPPLSVMFRRPKDVQSSMQIAPMVGEKIFV